MPNKTTDSTDANQLTNASSSAGPSSTEKDRQEELQKKLINSIKYGMRHMMWICLEQGADPNVVNDGNTALHLACEGSLGEITEITERLLAYGANPHVADKNGITLLQKAVINCNADMVKLLLAHGADPNVVNAGDTPLHLVCKTGEAYLVNYLLCAGANLGVLTEQDLGGYSRAVANTIASWQGFINYGRKHSASLAAQALSVLCLQSSTQQQVVPPLALLILKTILNTPELNDSILPNMNFYSIFFDVAPLLSWEVYLKIEQGEEGSRLVPNHSGRLLFVRQTFTNWPTCELYWMLPKLLGSQAVQEKIIPMLRDVISFLQSTALNQSRGDESDESCNLALLTLLASIMPASTNTSSGPGFFATPAPSIKGTARSAAIKLLMLFTRDDEERNEAIALFTEEERKALREGWLGAQYQPLMDNQLHQLLSEKSASVSLNEGSSSMAASSYASSR